MLAGLAVALAGTVLVTFSIDRNPGNGWQDGKHRGEKIYLASILHPRWLRWGAGLIILGFAVQISSVLYGIFAG